MDRADAPCAGAALLASSSFTMTAASFFTRPILGLAFQADLRSVALGSCLGLFSYAYRTSGARAGGV